MAYVNMDMGNWGGSQAKGGSKGKGGKAGKSWDTQHGGSEKEQLVDQVKAWQRKGEAHKAAWYNFCGQQGTSNYDPNRHEVDSLQLFMISVESGTITPDESGGAAASKSWTGGGEGGDEKDQLVTRVKAYQRQGENHKQQWYEYVQAQGSQNYDPNRHEDSVLTDFLQNAEAGQLPMPNPNGCKGGGKGKGGGGGSSMGGNMNWQSGGGGGGSWGGSDWGGSGGKNDNSTGGAGGKPGDWVCPSCQNVNFSYRKECNKCNTSSDGAERIGLKPGDWICPQCNDLVFASKSACKMCNEPKPAGAGDKGGDKGKGGGKGKKSMMGGGGFGGGGCGMGGCGGGMCDMASMMGMMGMDPSMMMNMMGNMGNMGNMMGNMGNMGGGGGRSSPY